MALADNLAKAQAFLAPFRDHPILNHIGGADCPARSGRTFDSVSPI